MDEFMQTAKMLLQPQRLEDHKGEGEGYEKKLGEEARDFAFACKGPPPADAFENRTGIPRHKGDGVPWLDSEASKRA